MKCGQTQEICLETKGRRAGGKQNRDNELLRYTQSIANSHSTSISGSTGWPKAVCAHRHRQIIIEVHVTITDKSCIVIDGQF